MNWDLTIVAKHTNGKAKGNANVRAVCTDSRQSMNDDVLFVALRGEKFDGHDYARSALEHGAGSVMVENDIGAPSQVIVSDTLVALRDLAGARRDELEIPVVGITGSSGKTSTKDLIGAALGPRAHASPRSFNNEIGVPLTVLSTPDDARYLVVEIGSRGHGHIASLIPSFRPTVGVITTIGVAHSEFLKTAADVRTAKYELAAGTEGVLVLPAGDELLLAKAVDRSVITFGSELSAPGGADYWARQVEVDESGRLSCVVVTPDEKIDMHLQVAGLHNAHNLAAAFAVSQHLGRSIPDAVAGLEAARLSKWRMDVHTGHFTVVDDSYNANPDSMEAALRTVSKMGGRPVAILGPMEELGEREADDHQAVGALARSLGFKVVVIGPDRGYGADVAFRDVEAAQQEVPAMIEAGDVVLVKASRSAGLDRVAEVLIEELQT